jgi:mRNA interferase MazF
MTPITFDAPQVQALHPEEAIAYVRIKLEPDANNGLTKVSAIDALQLRGVDLQRFIRRLGNLSEVKMSEIAATIVAVIDYEV